jgi:mRNA interferase MazF
MSKRAFIPDRGDLIWITLNPVAGHEQAGRRPALVISPKSYNKKTGLRVLCPATRQRKGYAFEVDVSQPSEPASVVLADHLRNVDWRACKAAKIGRVTDAQLAAVVMRIEALLVSPD